MDQNIALTVNGNPVTRFEYDNSLQEFSQKLYGKPSTELNDEQRGKAREFALDRLIAKELLFQEALSRGIIATEDDIRSESDKLIEQFQGEGPFFEKLSKLGIDRSAFWRIMRKDMTVNLISAKVLEDVQDPSEAQIREVYEKYPQFMKIVEQVQASHILIRVDPEAGEKGRAEAKERMEELRSKVLVAGADFAKLAYEHSDCPSAGKGGDLGFFKEGDMVKPFEEAAFSQKPGEVGPIVETDYGFHLIHVAQKQPARNLTLEEAQQKIREFLKEDAGALALKELTEKLRSAAAIETSV